MPDEQYRIRVKEVLDSGWAAWFEDMRVVPGSDGTTDLIGNVPDQSALHGLLARVRDLNLTLILLERLDEF